MRIKTNRIALVCAVAICGTQPASALSLLGGGFSDHLWFTEFYSALPYEDAKKCALGLHGAPGPKAPPAKIKKTKTSVIEQLEFDKYGFEMLEFEKGADFVRIKERYSGGFTKYDPKTRKVDLAYEKCAGTVADPLADAAFSAASSANPATNHIYETKFGAGEIIHCMSGYPNKVLSNYEMSYMHVQVTAFSAERIRIKWARSRSMQLAQAKFGYSHFIVRRDGRTFVGLDAGSKGSFIPALKTNFGDASWMASLARSCAAHGDDREVVYWPRSDK